MCDFCQRLVTQSDAYDSHESHNVKEAIGMSLECSVINLRKIIHCCDIELISFYDAQMF